MDILNQPLPSQRGEDFNSFESYEEDDEFDSYFESDEFNVNPSAEGSGDEDPGKMMKDDNNGVGTEGFDMDDDNDTECGEECGDTGLEGFDPDDGMMGNMAFAGDEDDMDDFDPDDLSDEELDAMDRELGDDMIGHVVPDEPEVSLSPDEEIQADDMMSVAATTALINKEMNTEERMEFANSDIDTSIAINEGFLLPSDVEEMKDSELMSEASFNANQNVVHLNKKARLNQLYALAVNVSAAAHNDPDYRVLRKLNYQRKVKRKALSKKYHSEALKRMRVYWKRLKASKSKPLSDLAKKYNK